LLDSLLQEKYKMEEMLRVYIKEESGESDIKEESIEEEDPIGVGAELSQNQEAGSADPELIHNSAAGWAEE